MREIKFRGKSINGNWYYGYLALDAYSQLYIESVKGKTLYSNKVIAETICQHTGLKDKNGVEIYEGDYLKIIGATINEESFEGEVIFQDGTFGLKSKTQPKPESYTEMVRFWNDGSHDHHSLEMIQSFEMEVIGNIQENPELCQK